MDCDPKQASNSGLYALPAEGFIRLEQIIGNKKAEPPIPPTVPVSKSTWWAGVKTGRFPAPTRVLGGRIAAWRVEDIRALIEGGGAIGSESRDLAPASRKSPRR